MLFDLRARGRRRTVKVVYGGLAVLLFIGLVFLGVGGLGGGSVLEGVSKEGHGGSSYAAKVAAAKKRIKKNPSDASAWVALTEAQLHESTGGEFYDSETEAYTSKGRAQLRKAANSWNHYLALNPKPASAKLAREIANIFGAGALDEPANAVQALQIVIAGEPPSAALYSELAEYAYLARNESEGDLATKKAVALAPKTRRALLESELERVKRSVKESEAKAKAKAKAQGTAAGTSTSTTVASSSSSTVTIGPSSATSKKK